MAYDNADLTQNVIPLLESHRLVPIHLSMDISKKVGEETDEAI